MLAIVNPAAAGGRLGRQWPELRERLRKVGFEPEYTFTKAPSHATELAACAVRDGAEIVVAAGGDGTICEVLQGLHQAGRGALAILPLGTGNDAARTLGVPVNLEAAAQLALGGVRSRVDIMRLNDRVVLNAIGIGLLGAINVRASTIKVVRGITAYLVAAAGSLLSYRGPHVRLTADDYGYEGGMVILAVHNGPTTGGGFRLAPAARPADGMLDACLVGPMGALRRLHRLTTALRGTLGEQKGSHSFTFRRLVLESEVRLPAHLDGNHCFLEPPRTTIEVVPAAQEVIAGLGT